MSISAASTHNVKTNVPGIFSKIDTNALIEQQLAPQNATINKIKDQITLNNQKMEKLSDFSTMIKDFSNILDSLRFIPYNYEKNLFGKRQVLLSPINNIAADNYLNIIAKNGAPINTFDIVVSALAQAKVQKSADFNSKTDNVVNAVINADTSKFNPGSFQINGVNITISNNDSLNSINNKINALSNHHQVTSNVMAPAKAGKYNLILTSKLPGIDNAFIISDNDNVLNGLMATNATATPNSFDLKLPLDAKILYDNSIEVTRGSNKIDDFIDDMTFILYHPTPSNENIRVQIAPDFSKVAESIGNFVIKYNQILEFRADQQRRNKEGKLADTAILSTDNTLNIVSHTLDSILGQPVNGLAKFKTIFEIGIKMELVTTQETDTTYKYKNNQLNIDPQMLIEKLVNDFDDVRKLFEIDITISSDKLILGYKRGQQQLPNDFTLDVDINRSNPVIANYTDSSGAKSVNLQFKPNIPDDLTKGGYIVGVGAFDKWEFKYFGAGVELIDIHITQGIADRLYYALANIEVEQQIDSTKNIMQQDNIYKQSDIKRKTQQMDREEKQLVNKYAVMETKVGKTEALREQLKIQHEVKFKT